MPDKPERPRVVVTGCGGPAGLGVVRAISGAADVYAADIDPYAQGLFEVEPSRRLIVPRGDDPRFAPEMRRLCAGHRIDALVPTVEVELAPLVAERRALAANGVALVAPAIGALNACLDKWSFHRALTGHDALPRTELISPSFDPGGWRPPLVIKPRRGSGSSGVRTLGDLADLERLPRDGSLIAQEYLPGQEFSVDVLQLGDRGAVAVARERLKVDSGIAVTARVIRDQALEDLAMDVTERVGVSPIANVQFRRRADGEPRLLEVNPRVPGTIALSIAAGVNMPELALRHALGEEVDLTGMTITPVGMTRALQDRVVTLDEIAALERRVGLGAVGL
jgi:carbamoyl-phosphate synthase large subunit